MYFIWTKTNNYMSADLYVNLPIRRMPYSTQKSYFYLRAQELWQEKNLPEGNNIWIELDIQRMILFSPFNSFEYVFVLAIFQ